MNEDYPSGCFKRSHNKAINDIATLHELACDQERAQTWMDSIDEHHISRISAEVKLHSTEKSNEENVLKFTKDYLEERSRFKERILGHIDEWNAFQDKNESAESVVVDAGSAAQKSAQEQVKQIQGRLSALSFKETPNILQFQKPASPSMAEAEVENEEVEEAQELQPIV